MPSDSASNSPQIASHLQVRRRWRRRILRWTSPALDLLFPPRCLGCGDDIAPQADSTHLCTSCMQILAPESGTVCPRCAAPLAESLVPSADCPLCRDSRLHFDGVTSLGVYSGGLRTAVLRMKHQNGEALALAAGRLLADRLESEEKGIDLVAPMPMHWTRRLWRSMNSPDVLAEAISSHLGLPLAGGALIFRRITRQQSLLPPSRRRGNMRDAFAVTAGYNLAGARILLVDDILTTGATASSAAKVLCEAGAARVSVAVVGRGVGID